MQETVIALITAVASSGVLSLLFKRWFKKIDAAAKSPTSEDLRNIDTRIKSMDGKLDRDFAHMRRQDEQIRQLKLLVLRQSLFDCPHDRNSHERQLKDGDEYLRLGGNGVGHIRYDQLRDDYARRLAEDDWNYTPGHQQAKGRQS